MPKIQTSCPQCQQPLVAEIFQVIDVKRTPQLKEVLLGGGLNMARCQICGFQGQLPVPLVYHDPAKELLLTFTPPNLNKTMEEKESALAPLLKDIIDNLKPEERKGYLFQPQAMLTMNNLVKNVLYGDGITEEMIQEQQEKMSLLDELFSKEGEGLIKTIQEKNQKIDREFFALFAEIAQRIIASQDQKSIEKIQQIQDALMAESDIGKEILQESQEIQAARSSLEALGKNLTRESLLELVIQAPSPERVKALAGLVRPAMDYEFFQKFTDKIERTADTKRAGLLEKRNLLLKVTEEIDKQVEERLQSARQLVNQLSSAADLDQALLNNISAVDQFFIQALSSELDLAQKQNNAEKTTRLKALLDKIQELTTPPELKVLDGLLAIVDQEEDLQKAVGQLEEPLAEELLNYLTSIIGQYQERIPASSPEDKPLLEESLAKINKVYQAVLKQSMQNKFKKG